MLITWIGSCIFMTGLRYGRMCCVYSSLLQFSATNSTFGRTNGTMVGFTNSFIKHGSILKWNMILDIIFRLLFFFYFNTCTVHFLLFCTMTNKSTITITINSHTMSARQQHQHTDCICSHHTNWLHENSSKKWFYTILLQIG